MRSASRIHSSCAVCCYALMLAMVLHVLFLSAVSSWSESAEWRLYSG